MAEDVLVDKRALSKGLARKIQDDIRDRMVKQEEFYDHLNKTVFLPVLGVELSRQAVKDIIGGIADQISVIVMAGGKVRLGKIGLFKLHITPPGERWDPRSKTKFHSEEKTKLAFKASSSSKRVFSAATATKTVDSDDPGGGDEKK
jgi:nucleoid DNA-binding protein